MAMLAPPQRFPWIAKHPRVTGAGPDRELLAATVAHPGDNGDGRIELSPLAAALGIIASLALVVSGGPSRPARRRPTGG
jgi:hypothetical protein